MRPKKNEKIEYSDSVFDDNRINDFGGLRSKMINNLIYLKSNKPKELGVIKLEIIYRDIKRKPLVNDYNLKSD